MAKKGKKGEAAAEGTEAQEVVAQVPTMPTQNGVTRPKPGTATGRVWEICDTISAEQGSPAARADVLKQFLAEGGNQATGATQYGRWRKFHGLGRVVKAKDDAPATAEATAEVEA